jgi:hypothetical protein
MRTRFSHEGSVAKGVAQALAHETSAAKGVARALAHELVPGGVMVWAVVAGHAGAPLTGAGHTGAGPAAHAGAAGAGAMLGAALVLAVLSFAYAPSARSQHWAREHLTDLWATLLLMAALAFVPMTGAESTFQPAGNLDSAPLTAHLGHGMGSLAFPTGGVAGFGALAVVAVVAVVAAWVLARTLLARRAWRIHSLVSAVACGTGLAWMLLA